MKNTQTACSFYIQDMYMKDKVFTYVHQERNFLPARLFLTSLSASAGRMGSSPEIDIGSVTATCRNSIYIVPSWNGVCLQMSGHLEIALLLVAFFIAVR